MNGSKIPGTIAPVTVLRGCWLERRGYPCPLCEGDRRGRHLLACMREDCALCELIWQSDGSPDFCVVEYRTARMGRAA